jgi:DNA-binding transcriptional MerR regulator
LRKPRKVGKNTADYNEGYIEQIRIIKALRENYFLPLPVIKKLIKKQRKKTSMEQISFQFLSEHFKPLDQLFSTKVTGRKNFLKETGLDRKWLSELEKWRVVTSKEMDGERVFARDDVIIGKLIVAMGNIGMLRSKGFDPEILKDFTDFFREMAIKNINIFWNADWGDISMENLSLKGIQATEILSLFFYHIYRKLVMEEFKNHLKSNKLKGKEALTLENL